MNIYKQRIYKLKEKIKQHQIDAYIVLTSDPHLNEYIPQYWQEREYLSGFTGSAGTLVITQNKAILFTDGRYTLQAQKELSGSEIILQEASSNKTYINWMLENINHGATIATNGKLIASDLRDMLSSNLASKQIKLLTEIDLIEEIWENRTELICNKIYEHEIEFCGNTRADKLNMIKNCMNDVGATHHLISSLDDIAWITNLRGSDIDYNPLFMSYMIITEQYSFLFVDKNKINDTTTRNLEKDGISIKDYSQIYTELQQLHNKKIMIDPSKTTAYVVDCLQNNTIIHAKNPSTFIKSQKTKKEIKSIQNAMIQDGIALCNFFSWLEDAIANNESISELTIDDKLQYFRSLNKLYVSDSFPTIAGFNENGALPHYRATKKSYKYISGNGLLLIDSGAQYKNGTTDITRVIPIGKITKEQKIDYTLVLKANISLSMTKFPENIPMSMLDSIARSTLWDKHIDYMHGTGHGVGYFLNVHEGPQSISYYNYNPYSKAKEGMVTSIEPGIYKENKYGIRLENLAVNQYCKDQTSYKYGNFMQFVTLTLCPFESKCIIKSMLNNNEIKWLNRYHKYVYKKLSKHLKGKPLKWLTKRCKEI